MTTAPPPYRLALLDLDGTLTDSAPGILSSVRHAYATLGIEPPTDDALQRFVGPPLAESFARHGVPADRVPEAVAAYRDVYAAGRMMENSLYPGILECLTAARDAGVRLAVATSKPEVYARRITAHFGIDTHVEGVYGATLDGSRGTKADVIEHALTSLAASPGGLPSWEEIVMVGDREHDVLGAAVHHITCLGVAWGYAVPGELEAAGALRVVATTDELARVLRGE
ncbi:HAD hydrolase-like protein [Oerskovia jenensis]|uniref:Phosphoglycolate phosphatase n=1 Tax=Oerskovia jenensis TaxID=162169 RepID=A0ABS2LHT3_9CELL|nr:HAD hydrolase-like protein [Oerskovia jenensis]MBM7479689.1 phosphoglycolate phosphatase [Oerskovia jenensis]